MTIVLGIRIDPTPGMVNGDAYLARCEMCGVTACFPTGTLKIKQLAACPNCANTAWKLIKPSPSGHYDGPFHQDQP